MPAPPPALGLHQPLPGSIRHRVIPMRFVAADAGFFPPGPLTLLADMLP